MKQALAIAAIAAVAAFVAVAPAGAAANKGPTLRSLQKQITTLKKQVTTLKKRTTEAENLAAASLAYSACSTAVTADAFQDTFAGLNGYFGAHSLPAYFGAQSALNDYGLCQAISVTRVRNQNPPTTNAFGALLDLFKGSSSSASAKQGLMDLAGKARHLFGQVFVLLR